MGEVDAVGEGGGEAHVGSLPGVCGKTLDMGRLEINPTQVGERLGEVGGSHKKLRMVVLTLSEVLLMSIVTTEAGRRGAGEKGVEGEIY